MRDQPPGLVCTCFTAGGRGFGLKTHRHLEVSRPSFGDSVYEGTDHGCLGPPQLEHPAAGSGPSLISVIFCVTNHRKTVEAENSHFLFPMILWPDHWLSLWSYPGSLMCWLGWGRMFSEALIYVALHPGFPLSVVVSGLWKDLQQKLQGFLRPML